MPTLLMHLTTNHRPSLEKGDHPLHDYSSHPGHNLHSNASQLCQAFCTPVSVHGLPLAVRKCDGTMGAPPSEPNTPARLMKANPCRWTCTDAHILGLMR
ncbi:hypothetical protein AAFF_G00304090 [Aldrovandia affinis]|uniref:Uncharacterized protein n=1 Tax=Aldrovandia affinis TaxID=143900 RepID=A0AAD7SPF2_9TELE|nr:hypothetical protein AAFF_G00304090 [Aldrovandia affinis]